MKSYFPTKLLAPDILFTETESVNIKCVWSWCFCWHFLNPVLRCGYKAIFCHRNTRPIEHCSYSPSLTYESALRHSIFQVISSGHWSDIPLQSLVVVQHMTGLRHPILQFTSVLRHPMFCHISGLQHLMCRHTYCVDIRTVLKFIWVLQLPVFRLISGLWHLMFKFISVFHA